MRERLFKAHSDLNIEESTDIRLGRLTLSSSATPKKRSRSSVTLPASPDMLHEEETPQHLSKRTRRERRPSRKGLEAAESSSMDEALDPTYEPSVDVVTTRPNIARTPRQERATVLYNRPFGPVMLTAEEIEKSRPPTKWPELTLAPPILAFRYWRACEVPCNEPSCVCKSGYFVARRFRKTFGVLDPPEAPSKEHPGCFWADARNHLQPERQDSPFVSVSNSLAWTLCQALKKLREGNCEVNLSVLSLDLDNVATYYVPLFRPELKRKFPFEGGSWLYGATNEYLVYYACKPLITVPLSELMNLASEHAHVGEALRLSDLGQDTIYYNILANWKSMGISFSPSFARSIAEIGTQVFGFTAHEPARWQAFVANICEGWATWPKKEDVKIDLATEFVHAITRRSVFAIDLLTQEKLKMAFLTGTRFAMCDRVAVHKPVRFRQIEWRSNIAGLKSPAQILSDQYKTIEPDLWAYEDLQNGYIESGKRHVSIAEVAATTTNVSDGEEVGGDDLEDEVAGILQGL